MLLRHKPDRKQGWFYRSFGALLSNGVIDVYGRTLRWVLRHQPLTLLVAVGTLVLTIFLYIVVPEGLFPGAGHRRDPRHFGSAADRLVRRDGGAAAGAGAR